MNDRVVTLAGALGALSILVVLALNSGGGLPNPAGIPTSLDQQANGYSLAWAWLAQRDEEVYSLRDRYTTLTQKFPRGGHLLITTLPQSRGAQLREATHLQDWLLEGNTVLVLASLFNDSGQQLAGDARANLPRLTGLHLDLDGHSSDPEDSTEDNEALDASETAPQPELSLNDAIDVLFADPVAPVLTSEFSTHPLVAGVARVEGRASALPTSRAQSTAGRGLHHKEAGGAILALLHLESEESAEPVQGAWLDVRGDANFIIVGLSSPFTNSTLQQADNAKFLANVVEWSLSRTSGRRGTVIFDDMHQGLSTLYDAEAFFSDSRLSITLWLLLGCWLLYVLGANNRLPGISPPQPARPRPSDLVRVTGGFLASREIEQDSAQRLFMHFFTATGHQSATPVTRSVDEQFAGLERAQRLPQATVGELKKIYTKLQSGKKIDLQKTHELMLSIRNQLS